MERQEPGPVQPKNPAEVAPGEGQPIESLRSPQQNLPLQSLEEVLGAQDEVIRHLLSKKAEIDPFQALAKLGGGADLFADLDQAAIRESMRSMGVGTLFEEVYFDSVTVLPNALVQQFLEANFVMGTHCVPDGLHGVGEIAGDVVTHAGDFQLALDGNGMMGTMMLLHLTRPFERELRAYFERIVEFDQEATSLRDTIGALSDPIPKIDRFRENRGWCETYVGRDPVYIPEPSFVEALEAFSQGVASGSASGLVHLAEQAGRLASELQPFLSLRDKLEQLRSDTGHATVPRIEGEFLNVSSPATSGRVSVHTHCQGDDLRRTFASLSDLTIISAQAGVMAHGFTGGGETVGEGFIFLLPETPLFPRMQEEFAASSELREAWDTIRSGIGQNTHENVAGLQRWTALLRERKQQIVRECVPALASERVLGFRYDMNRDAPNLHVSPVVSEAAFVSAEAMVADMDLRVDRLPWADQLKMRISMLGEQPGQLRVGLAPFPSVFE